MPKTTKTAEQQRTELQVAIEGARLRETNARLQREKLENRLAQLEHRMSTATGDAAE